MPIEVGLIHEITITVQESDTARAGGGESLPRVFSTPRMIAMLERTSHQGILPFLPEGKTSVGSVVNVRHLAATPVGMEVRFRAELLEVDGRRLRFKVQAWDAIDKIAEGEHERFIIDIARFEERLQMKAATLTKS